jgi:hypothetical protein
MVRVRQLTPTLHAGSADIASAHHRRLRRTVGLRERARSCTQVLYTPELQSGYGAKEPREARSTCYGATGRGSPSPASIDARPPLKIEAPIATPRRRRRRSPGPSALGWRGWRSTMRRGWPFASSAGRRPPASGWASSSRPTCSVRASRRLNPGHWRRSVPCARTRIGSRRSSVTRRLTRARTDENRLFYFVLWMR